MRGGAPPARRPAAAAPRLREPGASFVTLRRRGVLRGCTGRLEPVSPLVVDVARSAQRAASADPRVPPVQEHELSSLELKISVLSSLEPLPAESEAELLAALRPGVDGLVLREGMVGATFLPAVWESLPEPARLPARAAAQGGAARGPLVRDAAFRALHVARILGPVPARLRGVVAARQARQQLLPDPAEVAVAHHQHDVAGARAAHDLADQLVDASQRDGVDAARRQGRDDAARRRGGRSPRRWRCRSALGHDGARRRVGAGERVGELALEDARRLVFERGSKTARRRGVRGSARGARAERRRDRGRVVREVVDAR